MAPLRSCEHLFQNIIRDLGLMDMHIIIYILSKNHQKNKVDMFAGKIWFSFDKPKSLNSTHEHIG